MIVDKSLFVMVNEVANDFQVSKGFAYKLIKQMNDELKAQGYLTVAGRVSRKYYYEKIYGRREAE